MGKVTSHKTPLYYALDPLTRFLSQSDISEICVNRPREIFIERQGVDVMERHEAPDLSYGHLLKLAELIAEYKGQSISSETPLLSAELPDGERVQIVRDPCCKTGQFILSLRKQTIQDVSLSGLAKSGWFSRIDEVKSEQEMVDARLTSYLEDKDYERFIRGAIQAKKNIILSGMTSSGKTTALNAFTKEIPIGERLICIEDVDEVKPPHQNLVKLIYSKSKSTSNNINADDLLQATLRLRPDRILLSEIRGSEVFAYLESIETGHPGSLTTVHANSPERVINRLRLLLTKGDTGFDANTAETYVKDVVEVIVQIGKTGGLRYVKDIYFDVLHK